MKNVLALAMTALAGAAASAQTVNFQFDQFQENNGGEFIVESSSNLPGVVFDANGEFRTFCLEVNEMLDQTSTFDAALNTEAQLGGIGGGSPDPLDSRTAYLYSQFRAGTLAGYNFDASNAANGAGVRREDAARALQLAIWAIEEEASLNLNDNGDVLSITNINGGSSALERALAVAFVQAAIDAIANGDWTGIGNVRVLNITRLNSQGQIVYHQDVLALIPLPQAVGMAAAGLGLIATRRRRAM